MGWSWRIVGGAVAGAQYQAANQKRARWMRGCDLDDPVDDIRGDVAETLTSALSLHLLEPTHRTKAKDPEDVIQDYAGADLILDIRTSRWGIHRIKAPSPNGQVHFAVGYDGSLRLIDARKRAVVAEATCSVQFSNGDDPPTITELLEDDCALLDKGLMLSVADLREAPSRGARSRIRRARPVHSVSFSGAPALPSRIARRRV